MCTKFEEARDRILAGTLTAAQLSAYCLSKDEKEALLELMAEGPGLCVDPGTAAAVAYGSCPDPDTGLFFPAADTLGLAVGGVQAVTVLPSGFTGFGTVTPLAQVDVAEDALIHGLTVGRGGGLIATNTALGAFALQNTTTGTHNTASGFGALRDNTTGMYNTALGVNAALFNTTGTHNVAIGTYSLQVNLAGHSNVAIGYSAMANTVGAAGLGIGDNNVAIGHNAMVTNITGASNVAVGSQALQYGTNLQEVTAVGQGALQTATTSAQTTAMGSYALFSLTSADSSTAFGYSSLFTTTGENNVGLGAYSGFSNATGTGNVFLGHSAGYYEMGSNRLIIDNTTRADEADARLKALVVGTFAAAPANQIYQINAKTGINIANPRAPLEVFGGFAAGLNDCLSVSGGAAAINSGPRIVFHDSFGDNTTFPTFRLGEIGAIYDNTVNTFDGHLVFRTNTGTTPLDLSEKMRITGSGRIGVGTATPQALLHVVGSVLGETVRTAPTTFALLPAPALAGNGARAYITDSTLAFSGANLGSPAAGGGADHTNVSVVNGVWVIG